MRRDPWRLLSLDIACGALWTVAFPPYALIPLFWACLAYLFWRIERAPSARLAALRGYCWGIGVLWAAFYWLVHTMGTFGHVSIPAGLLATQLWVMFFALQFALLGLILHTVSRHLAGRPWALLFAAALVLTSIDILYPEHFAWDAALLLTPMPFLLQTLDLLGTAGVTFMLYLSAVGTALMLQSVEGQRQIRRRAKFLAPALLGGLLMVAYGLDGRSRWNTGPAAGPSIRLAGIQANIGTADKIAATRGGSAAKQDDAMRRYLALSRATAGQGVDVVVWPETAFPEYISYAPQYRRDLTAVAQELQSDFLIGAREFRQPPARGLVYNGAFLISHTTGAVVDQYYKHVLLPFGERIPLSGWLPQLRTLLPGVADYAAGDGPRVLLTPKGRLGMSICYEGIIDGYMHDLAALRPDVLVNITNDSWFGDTREPLFHLLLQSMRAIEYRLPLFRVANTGISAYVSPYGAIEKRAGIGTEEVLVVDVPVHPTAVTFYERIGRSLTRGVLGAGSVALLVALFAAGRPTAPALLPLDGARQLAGDVDSRAAHAG